MMKKSIAVAQALILATVISSLVFGADQIIQYNEAMVGASHPTLADTLNRGFLIDHEADGTHSASVIGSSQITDNSIVNADINSAAAIDATKIGAGGVTSTEFGYIGTLTSDAQTQINAKAASASLGTMSTQNSDNVSVTGGSIAGITDLAVADGGTGSSTAATARAALGTDNASNLTSGEVALSQGGFAVDMSGVDGVPLFTSGVVSMKTLTQFLALVGITWNSADNTWVFVAPATVTGDLSVTGEVTADQFNTNCSYADNTCGWNGATAGRPATAVAGDCLYDNTIKRISCYNGSGWDNVAIEP